jgi:hypothetical protein
MDMKKRTFAQRIAAKLEAFNERLEARNRKRQQILDSMRAEKDYDRSMTYMKEFFRTK